MAFKHGDEIEFCTTTTCKILENFTDELQDTKSMRITSGTPGFIYTHYWTIPGDIAVAIDIFGDTIVVSAREGHIAKVSYETDEDTGVVLKKFRGITEVVLPSKT
jgi:hypothetical protein